MHQVIVDLPQQVSNFFTSVLILVVPIMQDVVHDSTIGPVIHDRVKLHKVFVLRHFVILRNRHQHLDRRHERR